jgi:REP element-mobilizing transposase RayT
MARPPAPEPKTSSARKRKRTPKQLDLPVRTHGGARKGAGRKRKAPRKRVDHRTRRKIDRNHPVHVTIRFRAGLPSLRERGPMNTIRKVLLAARGRFDLRVIEFAVLWNHIHFLVEVESSECLTQGMRGLNTRLAIHLNRGFDRTGKIFDDRYDAHVLESPLEARNGLVYVLNNYRKHMRGKGKLSAEWIDPCSSGRSFTGWHDPKHGRQPLGPRSPTLPPRTWLLTEGWKKHGLVDPAEVPGGRERPPTRAA